MYKTVRHGENSLQYTILPQQDDGSGTVGQRGSRGLCRGRSHRSKRGRTTTILVVTLVLVCSIVAGSILVPLLMTTDMVGFRQASKTHVVVHHHHVAKLRQEANVTSSSTSTTTAVVVTTPEDTYNTLTTGGGGEVDVSRPENASLSEADGDVETSARTDADTTLAAATEGAATPTTTTTSTTTTTTATTTTAAAAVTTTVAATTTQKPLRKVNETVEEVDHNSTSPLSRVVGTTKIVVEATVAAGSGGAADRNWTEGPDVVIAKVTRPTTDPYRGWLPPRWPFADPSSYLQWTGYGSGHDSLLLPLLLGLVLVILLLILVFCYVMRRKHQKYLRREAIGKMSSDLQCDEAGDKSTLLQETNSEEE